MLGNDLHLDRVAKIRLVSAVPERRILVGNLRPVAVDRAALAKFFKAARNHLRQSDEVMKAIIKQVGPFRAKARRDRFRTLVYSIISQQISVAAASTIKQRLVDALGPGEFGPGQLLKFSVDELREVGVSRQKASYVLDLASKVDAGTVDLKTIHKRDDESLGNGNFGADWIHSCIHVVPQDWTPLRGQSNRVRVLPLLLCVRR